MTSLDGNNQIGCHETQLLMSAYMEDDPILTQAEQEAFEAHLLVCSTCAEEYEETKWLIPLVKKYWGPISEGTRSLLEKGGYSVPEQKKAPSRLTRSVAVEEGWEDLKRRSPSLAAACRRQEEKEKRRRLFRRVGTATAAASILIAVGIGWIVLQNRGKGWPTGQDIVATQTQDRIPANAFTELVTFSGPQRMVLGQPVKTGDRPQEIMLGGMHRVVMNTDTVATFDAARTQSEDHAAIDKVTYELQLAKGELYVEVAPGHPFTVKTDNAMLTITGTKFDVLADPGRTELTLVKGSVRFSQPATSNNFVDVTAGYASIISGRSAPTAPHATDALAATAWARDLALTNAIGSVQPDADLHLLESIRDYWLQLKPLDLDAIDYVKWRDDRRDWFAREFPWTFRIQKYLSEQHGIEADYVDLLMVSGDIWQFHYPRPLNRPIPSFQLAGIERVAKRYSLDLPCLLEAVGPPDPSRPDAEQEAETPQNLQCPEKVYRQGLERWRRDIASAIGHARVPADGLLIQTLRANAYLATTRQAAYLWAKTYPDRALLLEDDPHLANQLAALLPQETLSCEDWMESLAGQIAAAHEASNAAAELFVAPREAKGCQEEVSECAGRLSDSLTALAAVLDPELPPEEMENPQ